jgi:hypothetical protein
VDELAANTVVYLPPDEVYEFIADFPRYTRYSDHLVGVDAAGDGGPGTRYTLRFEWWKLSYTARSEVTAVDPPRRLDFRVTKDVDARGCWLVEELDSVPADAPEGVETACRVWFEIAYDPGSVSAGIVDLPAFVSLDWVVDKLQPVIREEAERVVERIVADIEGRRRRVEVDIGSEAPHL